MSGLVVMAVGIVLCFFGIASIHLQVLTAGFGLAWLLADLVGTSATTKLAVGLGGAVLAWVLATLVFKVAALFVGGIVGAVIGAWLSVVLQPSGDRSVLLGLVLAGVLAVMSALLADRYRSRSLLWLTTIGGAGLVLVGLARAAPDQLAFLRSPDDTTEQVVVALLWGGLAVAGWVVQRRLFPRALEIDRDRGRDRR